MAVKTRRLPDHFDALLSRKQIAEALSVSVNTLDRLIQRQEFPRHERRIGRMQRWRVSTVQRYIDGEMSGSDAQSRRVRRSLSAVGEH